MPQTQAYLIDGTAFCYRAFYAIRALSTAAGRPTNAVYGFAMMLKALRKHTHPDYLAVAFDAGKPTFRHAQFEQYKAQRKPMPDPLISQLPLIHDLLAAYRVRVFQREGYEAEDLLATIATRIASPECAVFLVTGDKDALQLVTPHVKVYNPHKDHAVYDADAVQARYGVPPERVVDLMALMGDDIDNIPGVPGIGEKTASELLKQFGTLDSLYEHLDQLKSAGQRAALQQYREQVLLARELARINDQAPVEVHASDLVVQEPDWAALRKLFRMLEFKKLLDDIDALAPADARPTITTHVIRDASGFKTLAPRLRATDAAAIWTHPDAPSGVTMLALAWEAAEAWLVPLEHSATLPGFLDPLRTWLASADHPKMGHDVKLIQRSLAKLGQPLRGVTEDTMIAAHLINPARANPSLTDTAEEWLELRLGAVTTIDLAATEETRSALASHVCAIVPLVSRLRQELERAALGGLYCDLELPLTGVLAQMEADGVALDAGWLASLKATMQAQLQTLTEELHGLAGTEFNLNSPKQLADVLFVRLKLPVIKRTKTGPSTDSEVLRQLSDKHPMPAKLMEYRELSKLVSTYVDALPQLLDPVTHRLHSTFHQTMTATGRLSSSDPNLQNIPIKTEVGRQIRKAFIPGDPEWVLVAADYSQIELRLLAHLSQDPELLSTFKRDGDIHRHTASLIYGVPESEVTPAQRSAMKAVNFGIIYGMSAFGLSKGLDISNQDAATFIEEYFARYPRVRAFLNEQVAAAKQDGYVQTLLGRRRYIPELGSPDGMMRQFGERIAVNAPIQGTAADIIKLAMVTLARRLRADGFKSRMILQVHDELVFEAPPTEVKRLAGLVREVMEQPVELSVPLRVVVKTGPNWLDMTEQSDIRRQTSDFR